MWRELKSFDRQEKKSKKGKKMSQGVYHFSDSPTHLSLNTYIYTYIYTYIRVYSKYSKYTSLLFYEFQKKTEIVRIETHKESIKLNEQATLFLNILHPSSFLFSVLKTKKNCVSPLTYIYQIYLYCCLSLPDFLI